MRGVVACVCLSDGAIVALVAGILRKDPKRPRAKVRFNQGFDVCDGPALHLPCCSPSTL